MPTDVFANSLQDCMLAALPESGGHFNIAYIVLFFLAVILWGHNSAWTQQDLKKIKVPQTLWIWTTFGTGVFCLILWLLVPLYWVGFALFAVIYGSAFVTYVVFRNRRVAPARTVLTINHLRRLTQGGGKTKEEVEHAQDRVRIKDADGKTPAWPKDPVQHEAYQVMQDLLFDAIWQRSSDIRMDLLPNRPVKVIYKVDGVDRAREPIDAQWGPLVFAHFKRISGMDPEEQRRPQSGGFQATIGAGGSADKKVDVEIKTSGSTAGQRILMRLITEEAKFRVPDLGFTKTQLELFEERVAEPKGVILITGPPGTGMTSTLYAILRGHDAFMHHIHTLELNRTMDLENITQHMYYSRDGAVSFGKKFRSILRTEPDIVMAGDTPDTETAALAAAAGRSKKIYLGMSAKDTFTALRRYLQGVNDNPLAASSLLAITCQRLPRVVCKECRRAYKPDVNLLKKANLPLGENRPFYRPPNPNEIEVDKQGNPILCPACQGTGYVGRSGVFELLILDDDLREQIAKGAALTTIKVEARKKGMLYLQEISLHKVYEGHTSINEVRRVTKDDAPRRTRA